jgi:hypothetical protein
MDPLSSSDKALYVPVEQTDTSAQPQNETNAGHSSTNQAELQHQWEEQSAAILAEHEDWIGGPEHPSSPCPAYENPGDSRPVSWSAVAVQDHRVAGHTTDVGGANLPSSQTADSTLPGKLLKHRISGLGRLLASKDEIRNHELRHAVSNSDETKVRKILSETNLDINPGELSSKRKQNAFHKLAQTDMPSADLTDALFDRMPTTSRGGAASAKDIKGNTPVHLAQYKAGWAEAKGDVQSRQRLDQLSQRLSQEASLAGRPVTNMENQERKTPTQMREQGKQDLRTAQQRYRWLVVPQD